MYFANKISASNKVSDSYNLFRENTYQYPVFNQ